MRTKFLFLTAVFIALGTNACFAKKIKITCDQEDAKIYVDNDYMAQGSYVAEVRNREGHIRVKIEKEGYVTRRFKIKSDDKRKAIDIVLEKDEGWNSSSANQLANKFFAIPVDQRYIEKAGGKEEAAKLAWKQLHQILLNYIEEIEESNMTGGYIQSAWAYKSYTNSSLNDFEGIQWRTRVTIKESSDGDNIVYRIKIASEVAPINAISEDYFQPIGRVLKAYEPMISEFQARLGSF